MKPFFFLSLFSLYKVMTEALRPLGEEKSRSKRETVEEQKEQLNDETNASADDEVLERTKYEINSTTNSIQLPLGKKGNPAFSIHASTVYILYPSLFQDPNIFGRFSIPQSINMDRSVSGDEKMKAEILKMPPHQQQLPNVPLKVIPGRKGKRSAEPASPPSPKQQADEKKNIETHLTGTIVVQNQDVNENNRRDSY
jgi:hypothetical protein